MKALLFANRVVDPVPAMTGIGRYVHEITVALATAGAAEGWSYDVSAPTERGRPGWLPEGVGYRPVPGPRRPLHLAWTAIGGPRLERLVGGFDLVHALHPSFPVPTRQPAVVTVHDLMPLQHPDWYDRGETWGFRRTLDGVARDGSSVIAVSRHVAGLLEETAGVPRDRITVIHEAVDGRFGRRVAAHRVAQVCVAHGVEPGRYLLALGNISTRKNLGTVVRAMAAVEPADLPLLVIGRTGPKAAEVRAEVSRRHLEDRVRIGGFVEDEALPALLQGALALVHPSLDEGFGFPPLEAMAAATPVVAAMAGSVPEIVGAAGVLVEALDVDAWAAAITRVAADAALRTRLAALGVARASDFTWPGAARRTLAVHRAALGDALTG